MWKLVLATILAGLWWAMLPDQAQSQKDGTDFYCKHARYKESVQYRVNCPKKL